MMIIAPEIDHPLRVDGRPLAISGQTGMTSGRVTDRQVAITFGRAPGPRGVSDRHPAGVLGQLRAPSLPSPSLGD